MKSNNNVFCLEFESKNTKTIPKTTINTEMKQKENNKILNNNS